MALAGRDLTDTDTDRKTRRAQGGRGEARPVTATVGAFLGYRNCRAMQTQLSTNIATPFILSQYRPDPR